MIPSTKLNSPQPRIQEPTSVRVDRGTSGRLTALQRSERPTAVITQVKAWNSPSQNMLISTFTRVTGGRTAESMLWTCRIWWNRIPSTNPPMPIPSAAPAAMSGLLFTRLSMAAPPSRRAEVDRGGDPGEHAERERRHAEVLRERLVED